MSLDRWWKKSIQQDSSLHVNPFSIVYKSSQNALHEVS